MSSGIVWLSSHQNLSGDCPLGKKRNHPQKWSEASFARILESKAGSLDWKALGLRMTRAATSGCGTPKSRVHKPLLSISLVLVLNSILGLSHGLEVRTNNLLVFQPGCVQVAFSCAEVWLILPGDQGRASGPDFHFESYSDAVKKTSDCMKEGD